jgi:hypothetical protein
MADKDFKVFEGKFPCKKCHEEVTSLRLWTGSGDATWMCTKKHVSKVNLKPEKKKKADFINE